MPYIANKSNLAQLTNIHYWDSAGAPAWSGNLIGAATPFAFLPNPVVAGDLVLFGIDSTILNAGPFCSLVFDIGSVITDVTGITWRYSDAGGGILPTAWAAQVVQDNTNQDGAMTGVAFDTSGVKSVHWIQDALWVVQNPTIGGVALGVTGLWICAHVTAAGGAGTPPIQNNRDIYTITWPSVEIAADTVGGDLDALLRLQVQNQSDHDYGFNPPELWTDNALVGLRSVDRGADFTAYLNASDVQQPSFISCSTAFGVFTNDIQTPTGRKIRIANVPVGPVAGGLARWDIDVSHAVQFYGVFHAFARVHQYSGGAADTIRLWCIIGAGVTAYETDTSFVSHVNDWAVVDLGRVSLPGYKAPVSEPTRFTIMIQGYGDGVEDLDIYDLILIPVDEWAGRFYNFDEQDFDAVGGRGTTTATWDGNRLLDIDGISVPKRGIWPVTRLPYNNLYWDNEWRAISPAQAILNAGDQAQRLWFFLLDHYDISLFEIGSSIYGLQYVQRYSSMRGAR